MVDDVMIMIIDIDPTMTNNYRLNAVPNASLIPYLANITSCTTLGYSTTSTTAFTSVPDAPKLVEVRVAGDNALSIAIEPPDNDGGANITH